jgi:polyhydroxyalkanoate synthase
VRFVLSGSGHIAGVVNPPAKAKYGYWTGPSLASGFEAWRAEARETPGSWWPDWLDWLTRQAPARTAARRPEHSPLAPICDAPGDYVRVAC